MGRRLDEEWEVSRLVDSTNPKDAIGVKKAPLRLVPPALAIRTAEAMALGAEKYGPFNWRSTDVRLTVYLEALLRHVFAYMDGEDFDPESGKLHLSHASACLAIVFDAGAIGRLIDDRPVAGPAAALLATQDRTKAPATYGEELERVAERMDREDGENPFRAEARQLRREAIARIEAKRAENEDAIPRHYR
jgi:Domain of unknown function (DUF5664)